MLRTLLVPLDGSSFGEHALPYAGHIAEATGARIELAHVHLPHVPETDVEGITPYQFERVVEYDHQADSTAVESERRQLQERAARLAEGGGIETGARVLRGSVAATLHRHAEALRADLVVMASHGRGGLSRAWLGSVADYLIRHASMPVLLVRPDETRASRPEALARILVPLDGSSFSEQVLGPLTDLAEPLQARVTLLRVLTPVMRYGGPPAELDSEPVMQERASAGEYLQGLASRLARILPEVDTDVVAHPQAATAILDAADRHACGLIALATHGRGGIARLLLGSTADKVVRATGVPVLAFRPRAGV